jgi:hypothetical protein
MDYIILALIIGLAIGFLLGYPVGYNDGQLDPPRRTRGKFRPTSSLHP